MEVNTQIFINKPKKTVWKAITDIENCQHMISAIVGLKVLNTPEKQLIGLKWQETRLMFGKEATETMWITDALDLNFYRTRAESHGSIYVSELMVESQGEGTVLTMKFSAKAQSVFMRCVSMLMTPFIKSSVKKMLHKDLVDIKHFLEKNESL